MFGLGISEVAILGACCLVHVLAVIVIAVVATATTRKK